jgi:hypothetical protein
VKTPIGPPTPVPGTAAPPQSAAPPQKKKGARGLIVLVMAIIAVLLAVGVLYVSGGLDLEGASDTFDELVAPLAGGDGAPVTLVYDEYTFTLHNGGDYTLDVGELMFVRGGDRTDGDDFSGDRIPGDELPADQCFQIVLQNRTATVPVQCDPINEHRHGREVLIEPLRLHWRAETPEDSRVEEFSVYFAGQLLARCDTVARGETGDCQFTWPVAPPEDESEA